MAENADVKAILYECSEKIKRQRESVDTFKGNSRMALGSSSLIISLIGIMRIFTENMFWSLEGIQAYLSVMAGLYAILVLLSLSTLLPTEIKGPIKIDKGTLFDALGGKEERDVIIMQISSYLNVVQLNKPKIHRLYKANVLLNLILAALVLMILAAPFLI